MTFSLLTRSLHTLARGLVYQAQEAIIKTLDQISMALSTSQLSSEKDGMAKSTTEKC